LSPSGRVGGPGKERGRLGLEFLDKRRQRIRWLVVRRWTDPRMRYMPFLADPYEFPCGAEHNPMRVADAAIAAGAAVPDAAFRERTDPRLKELVGGDTKEIGNPVEMLNRDAPAGLAQRVTQPAFGLAAPLREIPFRLVAGFQQRFNIELEDLDRLHVSTR
jgi:hypothetical protein